MNWEGYGRKQPWPNLRDSRLFPGRTENNREWPQDSRFPGRDLNPGPPEYEAGVLST
jgi:hypothetical protein